MREDVLSLAGGLPAAELFPTQLWSQAVRSVIDGDPAALQYGAAYGPLKDQLRDLVRRRGVFCEPEQIVATTGAQQAIDLLSRTLLDAGDVCAVEAATYPGALQCLRIRQATIETIGTDRAGGLRTRELEERLKNGLRPRMLYIVPDASNPTGSSLAVERRHHLAELAQSHDFWIVEDDAYGHLWLDKPPPPSLHSFAPDHVIHVGSFSKIVAPALRLGWMVAPRRLIAPLTVIKEANDLESSALTQRAASRLLGGGHLDDHLEKLRSAYRERRDAMLEALERHFPTTAEWTRPAGGMFVWVDLPEGYDTTRLLETALEDERIAFVPGTAFSADGSEGTTSLRLSFSNVRPDIIEDGIGRLGRLLHQLPDSAIPERTTTEART